jgi:NADH-quinone oxidoreductase subunit H
MIWIMNIDRYSGFIGDLIVIIYLLTIPALSTMIGASASRNPISALGASREMKLMLAYELPFLIAVFTVVAKVGSIILGNIIGYQSTHGAIIASPSGMIAFVVAVIVIQAKLGFVPFDMSEAEQELMGGTCLEYSGALLAVFKITKAMLLFTLPMLLITLFWGGLNIATFSGILWFILKYVIILILLVLIKNTNPRLRIDQAVRFFWGPVTSFAIAGLLLALIGL